nr:DUF1365 domain-containing protein [Nocardia sp. BMG51109]
MTAASHTSRLPAPIAYRCRLEHTRYEGVHYSYRHTYYPWLVDLDDLPVPPPPFRSITGFRAADHLGSPRRSLRANVDRYLAVHGIDLSGGRVLMLAQARAFGYVFDPLSLFWCHDRDGRLVCVIMEVRNTFHERHCYLLPPDPGGRATVTKEFYVSPFLPVDGKYLVRWRISPETISLTVVLRRMRSGAERTTLVATVRGARVGRGLVSSALSAPLRTWGPTVAIHYRAWRLRSLGLPLARRRFHPAQPGVSVDDRNDQ